LPIDFKYLIESLSHSFLRPGEAIEPVSGYALLMFYLTLDPIKDII